MFFSYLGLQNNFWEFDIFFQKNVLQPKKSHLISKLSEGTRELILAWVIYALQ